MVGGFNTPFSVIESVYKKKKISKNVEELSNPVNLFYIIDIYRHYSKISECVF